MHIHGKHENINGMKEDTLRTIINRKNEYLIIRFTNSLNGSKKEKKKTERIS